MKAIYTKPKIYSGTGKNKEWYIWFRYKGTLFKKRDDLNRTKNLKERSYEAEAIRDFYHDKLKAGWNPLVPDLESIEGADLTFYQALEFAMEKKSLSKKTRLDYNGTVKYCKQALHDLQMHNLGIADAKRVHIKAILEQVQKTRKWSNKAYNKNLGYLQGILSELIQWDIIPFNPAHSIKPLRVHKTVANLPPTDEQLKKIKNLISVADPDFWDVVSIIYHTGIRPGETTLLQVKMIDKDKRHIRMPARITKDLEDRIVIINDPLWKILEPRLNYPGEYYLFGSFMPHNGYKRNFKSFIPGPTKSRVDAPTRRWEKYVKKQLGMDLNLYGMKKAGANAKILAGMSVRTIKEIYGHSSELTTEIYITNIHEVIRKEIMDKSPSL